MALICVGNATSRGERLQPSLQFTRQLAAAKIADPRHSGHALAADWRAASQYFGFSGVSRPRVWRILTLDTGGRGGRDGNLRALLHCTRQRLV